SAHRAFYTQKTDYCGGITDDNVAEEQGGKAERKEERHVTDPRSKPAAQYDSKRIDRARTSPVVLTVVLFLPVPDLSVL
ncbi:hypothetical protein CRENBAI_006538, partial [Crenichthys baileyi]